jgi:hypothetical protein
MIDANVTQTAAPVAAPVTNNVFITVNRQSGLLVTPYKKVGVDGVLKGYVVLTEESDEISGQWLNGELKSCLMKGSMDKLQKLVNKFGKTGLPGRLTVREYVKSEVPVELFRNYMGDDYLVDFHKKAETSGLMKRAGNKGVWLTLHGEPIFRFTEYDPTGLSQDVRVAHDNGAAVKAEYAAQREKQAAAAAAHAQSLAGAGVNPAISPDAMLLTGQTPAPAPAAPVDPFAGLDEATRNSILAQAAQQQAAIANQVAPGVTTAGANLE